MQPASPAGSFLTPHRCPVLPAASLPQVAVRFAAAIGALEVIYLGVLWQQTGDLTAPMVAALR